MTEEPHPFAIELDRVGHITYVRLSGDAVWAYAIFGALRSLVDQRLDFVVDLRGLRHINDTNVHELLQGARWGIDYDLDVSFIRGSPEIQDEILKHPWIRTDAQMGRTSRRGRLKAPFKLFLRLDDVLRFP